MNKKLFLAAAPALIGLGERKLVRAKTRDVAYKYRMGAGFAGDVNRTHPFSVEACLIDPAAPPTFYGQAVTIGANNAVRAVSAADAALTKIYGVAVRPFPIQQQSGGMAASIGAATPPTTGVIDILRWGYIMVPIAGAPTKGGDVYVWAAAAAGAEAPGKFTVDTTGGSTIGPLGGSSSYNGPTDADGVGEVYISQ